MHSNTKGTIFLFFFRLSAVFAKYKFLRIIGFPVRLFYKLCFQWFLGYDIPDRTSIGIGFNVYHGQGLVIGGDVIIGDNVVVRQNTTIGNSRPGGGSPVIEDNVDIGANVVIIGDIRIGQNSVIGAGTVIVKDIPPNVLAVGNPVRIINKM